VARIIGIDPGSRTTGYGIIDYVDRRVIHVASGCIHTSQGALPERLKEIFTGVEELLRIYQPSELAIEKVFVQKNVDSALKLGQARGAAICAAVTREISVAEYSPNQIKQAVVGKGHAAKEQVQHMITILLKLAEPPTSDAADALACALCHGHTRETLGRFNGEHLRIGRGRLK
jgi:crossover junction endodeoxyribonuclease RuvC